MSLINRAVIFSIGTISNAVLFIILSRVVLLINDTGAQLTAQGPATDAITLVPTAMMLAIGMIQLGLVAYLLGGLSEERTVARGPM